MKKQGKKSELGSITLYVLVSMLFFLIMLIAFLTSFSNRIQSQERYVEKIQREYAKEDINEIYKEVLSEVKPAVARIGNVKYQTLQAAFDDVPKSISTYTEVVMLKSVKEAAAIVEKGKKIYLNLNGKTISSTEKSVISNYGEFKVNNGTIKSSSYSAIINCNSGLCTILGGTYSTTGRGRAVITNSGVLNISGGEFYSTNMDTIYLQNKSITTIDGGDVLSDLYTAVLVRQGATVKINNGNFTGSSGIATYIAANEIGQDLDGAVVEINGGTFKGFQYDGFSTWGIDGKITITGGMFEGLNFGYFCGESGVAGYTTTGNVCNVGGAVFKGTKYAIYQEGENNKFYYDSSVTFLGDLGDYSSNGKNHIFEKID